MNQAPPSRWVLGAHLAGANPSAPRLAPTATSATTAPVPASPTTSARQALDGQAAAAHRAGTRLTYDREATGRQLVDMSSFSDRELAAIVNDTTSIFRRDEEIWASGELNARVSAVLMPLWDLPDDKKTFHRTVGELYDRMDPSVRQALGWTPQMRRLADKLATEGATGQAAAPDESWYWRILKTADTPASPRHDKRLDLLL